MMIILLGKARIFVADSNTTYCTLTSGERSIRRSQLRSKIIPHVNAVNSLSEGLQLEFSSHKGLRDFLEEFIALEQSCCGCVIFQLSDSSNGLSLTIKGPPSAKEVIEMFRLGAQGEKS